MAGPSQAQVAASSTLPQAPCFPGSWPREGERAGASNKGGSCSPPTVMGRVCQGAPGAPLSSKPENQETGVKYGTETLGRQEQGRAAAHRRERDPSRANRPELPGTSFRALPLTPALLSGHRTCFHGQRERISTRQQGPRAGDASFLWPLLKEEGTGSLRGCSSE